MSMRESVGQWLGGKFDAANINVTGDWEPAEHDRFSVADQPSGKQATRLGLG